MTKPKICCTCLFWTKGEVDKRVGICDPPPDYTRATEWCDECDLWQDCDNETNQTAANLGYD